MWFAKSDNDGDSQSRKPKRLDPVGPGNRRAYPLGR